MTPQTKQNRNVHIQNPQSPAVLWRVLRFQLGGRGVGSGGATASSSFIFIRCSGLRSLSTLRCAKDVSFRTPFVMRSISYLCHSLWYANSWVWDTMCFPGSCSAQPMLRVLRNKRNMHTTSTGAQHAHNTMKSWRIDRKTHMDMRDDATNQIGYSIGRFSLGQNFALYCLC